MHWKLQRKIIITFISLLLISVVVFSALCSINWSLLTGFLIGVVISTFSYLVNELFISKLLSKRRSFKIGFVVGILKSLIWITLVSAVLIGILFANKLITNNWVDKVFNVFTFIYGVTLVPLSIIIFNFIDLFKTRKRGGE